MDPNQIKRAETVQRAYSTVVVKSIDDEKREITGFASTPNADRAGDIVDPKGADYALPLPLLWQHNHAQPIGEVVSARVTGEGIEIKARLARLQSPPGLAARLEEAWQSIKSGLVKGLSIGFRPIEYSFIDDGGIRFTRWEWYELSVVTVPMNAEATIETIKSFAQEQQAASGRTLPRANRLAPPAGASAIKSVSIKKPPKEGKEMNIQEKLKGFRDARAEKAAAMAQIMEDAGDATLDAAQTEEYDTLADEVKALDGHIKRYAELEALNAEKAKPVEDVSGQSRLAVPARAKSTQKLEPGVAFARFARVKLLSQIDRAPADHVARSLYPDDESLNALVNKTAVPAANTGSAGYAGDLINEGGVAFADFVEYLRPRSIVGQVQGLLRNLPFDTPVLVQNTGGSAKWVKEGDAKPLTSWSYSRVKLAPLVVASIAAATKQQLMRASVAADALFRDELARAVGERIDLTFIDPDVAPVTDESPGSIFNGVAGLTPSADPGVFGVRCDIATMLNAHSDANLAFDGLFWIMSGRNAIALSQMTNEIGNLAYPTVTPTGGTLAGFPVYVSNYAPTDSEGSFVALVKGSEIYIADEGGLDVAMSDQASLLMDDAPNMNSTTPTGASMVSMFQTNSVAFRVERFINWQRRRAAAVAWMSVNWDVCEGSGS